MSNKYKPPSEPPRYQPPPQVNSGIQVLKHYPPPPPPSLKDGKHYPSSVHVDGVKPFQPPQEVGKYYAAPPPPSVQVPKDAKNYPLPQGQGQQMHYPPPAPSMVHNQQQSHPQQQHPPQQNFQPIAQNGPKLSDEELLRMGPLEILKRLRKAEGDVMRMMMDQGQIMREVNRRTQGQAMEVRALKDVNQRLQDDNQELRDLCCFLDDDRQKGRKLAREWQRFGRYTASVMRQEVSAYQAKLRELDNKQQELIKDNLELKELCLYLDEERSQSTCTTCGSSMRQCHRDDGDGSSSSTNADEPPVQFVGNQRRSESRERLLEESMQRQRTIFNDQIMQYIRSLEQKVQQLEEEKRALQQKLMHGNMEGGESHKIHLLNQGLNHGNEVNDNGSKDDNLAFSRPEAVVHALQVLEVREQMERAGQGVGPDIDPADLEDGEKALIREMCNVVWKKLEETPTQRR